MSLLPAWGWNEGGENGPLSAQHLEGWAQPHDSMPVPPGMWAETSQQVNSVWCSCGLPRGHLDKSPASCKPCPHRHLHSTDVAAFPSRSYGELCWGPHGAALSKDMEAELNRSGMAWGSGEPLIALLNLHPSTAPDSHHLASAHKQTPQKAGFLFLPQAPHHQLPESEADTFAPLRPQRPEGRTVDKLQQNQSNHNPLTLHSQIQKPLAWWEELKHGCAVAVTLICAKVICGGQGLQG